jgi:transposase-like protein
MRENRLSGLMRGGSLAVIGCKSSHSVGSCLLYTVMEPGAEILKVDEVGRIQTPPEKREALLVEYDRSGMTGAQFARFSGVRYATLMYWLQKRRKEAGPSEPSATSGPEHPRWLEARVEGEVAPSENLVVEVGGGVRMLVSNRTQAGLAGEVLRAMGLVRGC